MKARALTYALALAIGLTAPLAAMPLGAKAFLDGNEAYQETNYPRAVQFYEKALQYGYRPGALYYNLGNACYRQGDLGRAIAAYRRALRQLPRDGDVRANLMTARGQASDGILPRQPSVALRSFLFPYYYLSLNELLWCAALLLAVVFLVLALYAFVGFTWLRRLALVGVVLTLVLAAAAAAHLYRLHVRRDGVVLSEELQVRNGPADSAVEMFPLHAGTEFTVEEQRGNWVKIEIAGKKGWVRNDEVDVL